MPEEATSEPVKLRVLRLVNDHKTTTPAAVRCHCCDRTLRSVLTGRRAARHIGSGICRPSTLLRLVNISANCRRLSMIAAWFSCCILSHIRWYRVCFPWRVSRPQSATDGASPSGSRPTGEGPTSALQGVPATARGRPEIFGCRRARMPLLGTKRSFPLGSSNVRSSQNPTFASVASRVPERERRSGPKPGILRSGRDQWEELSQCRLAT